jgi:hypothetical protein
MFGEMKGSCENLYNVICAAGKMWPTLEFQQQVSVLIPNKMWAKSIVKFRRAELSGRAV